MSRHEIIFPDNLTLNTSIEIANELLAFPEADEYVIDFGKLTDIEPFGLLLLSSAIQRCMAKHNADQFQIINYEQMSLPAQMGFFKAFDFDFGNFPGEIKGDLRYLPINILSCDAIRREASENYAEVGQIIENHSEDMAEMLSQSNEGNLFDTLTYSFREIIRNIVEHSNAASFGYCAQFWPENNKVEMALLDRGMGIRESLSTNPSLEISSDQEALNLSLMPGISSNVNAGSRQNRYDVWANSGFGLYMTSRICKQGGSFFVASGSAGLWLSENEREYLNISFEGVLLRLVININRLEKLSDMLVKFRDEGYAISKGYNQADLTASVASTMLSRDFKK